MVSIGYIMLCRETARRLRTQHVDYQHSWAYDFWLVENCEFFVSRLYFKRVMTVIPTLEFRNHAVIDVHESCRP